MARSAADAITLAIERSKQLLFPFDANKWFALGFTVFLAQCGEGGGSSVQVPGIPGGGGGGSTRGGGRSGFGRELQSMLHSVLDNLSAAIGIAVAVVLLGFGLWLLVAWFSSRAKLMFVESVIWDRVDVGTQWTHARELGKSLLKFRVLLGVSATLLLVGTSAGALGVGYRDFAADQFLGGRAIAAYVMLLSLWAFLGIPLALVGAVLDDFVVPLMVLRNVRVGVAWAMCRSEVLAGNVGGVALFYLLRVAIGMVVAILAGVVMCLTCCLAALPYLGTVALLPVHVFSRAYPLYYLEQLGIPVFPLPDPYWAAQERWRVPQ